MAAAFAVGVVLLGAGFFTGKAVGGATDPGSDADPLVSKGYVDQVVAKLVDKGYVDQLVSTLAQKGYVDQAVAPKADKTYVDGRTTFQVVNLTKGQSLIGEAGTEMALRAGSVTAIVSPKGGILDSTTGADLPQGEWIAKNHMLVIPVSDGRGVLAKMDAILIVKGAYTIK